jgi:hypothetical protein
MSEYMETYCLEFDPTGMTLGYLPASLPIGGTFAHWASKEPLPLKYITIDRFYLYHDLIEIHSAHCVTSMAETQPYFAIHTGRGQFKIFAPNFTYLPHSAFGTKFDITCENMFTRTMIEI